MANIYDMTDTWNNSGTVFTSMKMNVTATAYAAGSKLMDLQVGGVSKFVSDQYGVKITPDEATLAAHQAVVVDHTWNAPATFCHAMEIKVTDTASAFGSRLLNLRHNGNSVYSFTKEGWFQAGLTGFRVQMAPSTNHMDFISESGADNAGVGARRFAAIAVAPLTASLPGLSITQTWNNASANFHAMEIAVTKTASLTFGNTLIKASVDGVSKFEVGNTGAFTIGRGDTAAVDKGFEVFRYASGGGANSERFFFGYSATDVLINPFTSGTGVLTDFKIQYNSSTKIRLKSDGANLVLAASASPANNGDLIFERTSDTSLTVKLRGSDGVVRSAVLTLT